MLRNRSAGSLVGALMLVGLLAAPASASVIDFEDLGVAPGSQLNPADNVVITSGGFDFVNGPLSTIPDLHFPNASANAIGNSTELLAHDDVIMTRNGGGAFTLNSFMWGSSFLEEDSFRVIGMLMGGGMVTQTFFTDQDETTFQMFNLDPSFTNLVSVTWEHLGGNTGLQNIDNIVVDEGGMVPEPSTVVLLGLGFVALARRRRQSS